MKQPVLVRVLDDAAVKGEEAPQKAITDFNKSGTAALTPAEQAIADSHGVSQSTLDDISARMDREGPEATLSQVLDGRSGVEVLGKLMQDGVISPQEGAKLGTETNLTRAGKERISGLMLGRFFTNAKQLDALPDAIRGKMERIAAPLARIEGSPAYSLSPTIRQGLDLIDDAEAHGIPNLSDMVNQGSMFADRQYSPEALAIAQQLRGRDPLALTNAVRQYAAHTKYAAEYHGPDMFGAHPEPLTPAQAFEESFGKKAIESEARAKAAKREAAAAAKAAANAVSAVKSIGDLGNLGTAK
jgi:hypothetical protein